MLTLKIWNLGLPRSNHCNQLDLLPLFIDFLNLSITSLLSENPFGHSATHSSSLSHFRIPSSISSCILASFVTSLESRINLYDFKILAGLMKELSLSRTMQSEWKTAQRVH